MQQHLLILIGSLFLISLIVTPIAKRFNLPRVSLYILAGVLLNLIATNVAPPNITHLFTEQTSQWFQHISELTLLIIGYLLGTKLTKNYLKHYAAKVSVIALIVTLCTFVVVTLGLIALGFNWQLCVLLAALAVATDPAATLDVLNQQPQQQQSTNFSKVIQGIVALDDALALILFSLVLAVVGLFSTDSSATGPVMASPLISALWELLGAIVFGAIMGGLLVWLLNKLRDEKTVVVESLGIIMLCGGLASYLHLSFLLAAMTMGFVVVNNAKRTQQHLHEIEFIEQPFLVLFFILAGASMQLSLEPSLLLVLIGYVIFRITGRFCSGLLIPTTQLAATERHWVGMSLLPQAGIAMGMALMAANAYPQHGKTLITISIAATMIFEILGPIATQYALNKVQHNGNSHQ